MTTHFEEYSRLAQQRMKGDLGKEYISFDYSGRRHKLHIAGRIHAGEQRMDVLQQAAEIQAGSKKVEPGIGPIAVKETTDYRQS